MKAKKTFGTVLLIVGIVLLGFSFYIKKQVAEGKIKISNAEETVKRGSGLFNLSPLTQPLGQGITRSAERKIGEGNQQIAYYTNLANSLQIGGIVCIVLGIGVLVFSGRKSR